jgi:hypothetical protein
MKVLELIDIKILAVFFVHVGRAIPEAFEPPLI